jgi:pantoate--beta-alanine ligase
MRVFHTIKEIQQEIRGLRDEGKIIGFVPTMGALHEGHLSLLKHSVSECDISVASIFVNPIQFNNKKDLEKYPRTLDDDCRKLEAAACDLVFAPSTEEMYPDKVKEHYDFGHLEKVMEGAHRPGHFNGVAVVVKRLFEICLPHRSYFGEKDYQQLMIIKSLVEKENLPVKIIGCPIIRETDGLAMSSRNVRLSPEERSYAPEIFSTLKWIRDQRENRSVEDILMEAEQRLNAIPGMEIEYIQIADEQSLTPISDWSNTHNSRIFLATFLGDIRLIDNLKV